MGALAQGNRQQEPPIRVAICDDSASIRTILGGILAAEADLDIVARVADGGAAIAEVERRRAAGPVEVLLLDINMPGMDGMTALPLLMRADPQMRILVVSTQTTRGADVALSALRLGAADYVTKPSAGGSGVLATFRSELLAKVRGQGRLRRHGRGAAPPGPLPASARPQAPAGRRPASVLALGASTGGPQALFTLIGGLGQLPVPVVLTQHMPATFTRMLARHIGQLGGMSCAEAQDRQLLQPGEIVVAPGDRHLLIERSGGGLSARLDGGPPEHFCRPAVDPMLRSAAAACDGRVLVVLLTGMGQDGLAGTGAVVQAGGLAVAQDQASSVVWGMPGAIARAGLCDAVLPLSDIAAYVRGHFAMAPARILGSPA